MPTSVAIIDDHPIVRTGVRLVLDTMKEFRVAGEAGSPPEAVTLVESQHPDAAILDLSMGGNDGIELVRNLASLHMGMRILVYSMNDEMLYGPRALKAGASGYMMKDCGLPELAAALKRVCSGERYLSNRLRDALVDTSLTGSQSPLDALTDRELQVLRLIGAGRATGEIATELNISPKTVGAHRERLKHKLKIETAAELSQQATILVQAYNL